MRVCGERIVDSLRNLASLGNLTGAAEWQQVAVDSNWNSTASVPKWSREGFSDACGI
jgi:hypothetical protein